MNHTQKSSSFPHALRTRQFYRRKKPFFEIGSLLFGAARMPQDRPPTYATTANPKPYRRQARIRPVRSGFDLQPGPSPSPLPPLPTSRIFARFAALQQSPPIAKTKILTFLQLFFDYGLSSIPAKRKRAVLQLLTAFLSRDLRFGTTRQSAIAKKLHPDPIFCFWALEIVSGWHRGAVAVRAAKQKPGISLACMSENDAPPCGPHILEM